MEDQEEQIEMKYNLMNNFKNYEVFETKLSLLTRVQNKAYDKDTYKPEEKIIVKNEKDQEELKEIPLQNYIRWRNIPNNKNEIESEKINKEIDQYKKFGYRRIDKSNSIQSNCKLVEWSDGTYHLIVGEDFYDVNISNINNLRLGIYDSEKEITLINQPVEKRMLIKLNEYNSLKKSENLAESIENDRKVKLAYSYFDKTSYNKEEYETMKSLKKRKTSEHDIILNKPFKKRKRSETSDKR